MKILVMGHREDETVIFKESNKKYGFEITYVAPNPSVESAGLARGYTALTMNGGILSDTVLKKLAENGIKYLAMRAVGTDNIDTVALKRYGIRAANVKSYSPNAISEHTILLMLSVLRKFKEQQQRIAANNYLLTSLRGRELRDMTVGIIGTGRIGAAVAQNLSGFGCKVLANGHHQNPVVERYAEFVPLDRLFAESDIITLHCPMRNENLHMINEDSISRMKQGAILINTARGELVDTTAVYKALQTGKLGGFALDVYEYDETFLRKDGKGKMPADPLFAGLMALPNVVYTTHIAFNTDHALLNIIDTSLSNLYEFLTTGQCENDISPV
jgi:D-lactate dehydrogenase